MEPVRACLLVDTVGLNAGTERLVAETALRLNPSKVEVHVCCLEDSQRLRELEPHCKIKVFPASSINSLNGLRQIRAFRQYLREKRIEVMHSFMTRTSILGVAAFRKSRCKAIVTSRLSTDWYTSTITAFFRYYMNPRTTRILANAEAVRRYVIEKEQVGQDKVDVIYQGVDMRHYSSSRGDLSVSASLGIPDTSKVIGIVANYRPVKDLPLFLCAAALVAAQVPEAVFLLVGAGDLLEDLSRLAGELKIADRVFFTNGHGHVPDYLKRMCIGALSSESEGFSNAILEYMAAGLPVVATDVGGAAEAIEHGKTGFLVKSRDPAAFAAPLIQLLQNEELRSCAGRNSLERCRQLFSMDVYINHLEEYYRKLAQLA